MIGDNDCQIHPADIPEDYPYKCPICKDIVEYAYGTTNCEECDKYICNNCMVETFYMCTERDCPYCKRGNCYSSKIILECKKCYKDPFEKYDGITITYKMLKNDDKLDINPSIVQEKYKYKCPECKNKINFQNVVDCQNCKLYLCRDCIKRNYVSCGYDDCKYCKHEICYNSSVEVYCKECYPYDKIESSEESESEDDVDKKCFSCKKNNVKIKVIDDKIDSKCCYCKRNLQKKQCTEYYCDSKKCFDKNDRSNFEWFDDKAECDYCGRRYMIERSFSVVKL
jgi:hypothetical protein